MALRKLLARSLVRYCLLIYVAALRADDLSLPREYEGRPIEQVRFEPQLQPVAPADLARLVAFPSGTPLKQNEIRDAIKRLYGTGEYQDVEVSWEPSATGVTLVFRTI